MSWKSSTVISWLALHNAPSFINTPGRIPTTFVYRHTWVSFEHSKFWFFWMYEEFENQWWWKSWMGWGWGHKVTINWAWLTEEGRERIYDEGRFEILIRDQNLPFRYPDFAFPLNSLQEFLVNGPFLFIMNLRRVGQNQCQKVEVRVCKVNSWLKEKCTVKPRLLESIAAYIELRSTPCQQNVSTFYCLFFSEQRIQHLQEKKTIVSQVAQDGLSSNQPSRKIVNMIISLQKWTTIEWNSIQHRKKSLCKKTIEQAKKCQAQVRSTSYI